MTKPRRLFLALFLGLFFGLGASLVRTSPLDASCSRNSFCYVSVEGDECRHSWDPNRSCQKGRQFCWAGCGDDDDDDEEQLWVFSR